MVVSTGARLVTHTGLSWNANLPFHEVHGTICCFTWFREKSLIATAKVLSSSTMESDYE